MPAAGQNWKQQRLPPETRGGISLSGIRIATNTAQVVPEISGVCRYSFLKPLQKSRGNRRVSQVRDVFQQDCLTLLAAIEEEVSPCPRFGIVTC